jgi:hypothetical protein
MNILTELTALLQGLGLRVETSTFTEPPPETYTVITPMADTFDLFADNMPGIDVQEARVSLFCKSNYLSHKEAITRAVINAGFTITARQFIEKEADTGIFHWALDAAHYIILED